MLDNMLWGFFFDLLARSELEAFALSFKEPLAIDQNRVAFRQNISNRLPCWTFRGGGPY